MHAIANDTPQSPKPVALLAQHAVTSTASTLAEVAAASRRTLTGARNGRPDPLALASRGVRWWTSMADRRTPEWHLPHRTVLSTPFAHLHYRQQLTAHAHALLVRAAGRTESNQE